MKEKTYTTEEIFEKPPHELFNLNYQTPFEIIETVPTQVLDDEMAKDEALIDLMDTEERLEYNNLPKHFNDVRIDMALFLYHSYNNMPKGTIYLTPGKISKPCSNQSLSTLFISIKHSDKTIVPYGYSSVNSGIFNFLDDNEAPIRFKPKDPTIDIWQYIEENKKKAVMDFVTTSRFTHITKILPKPKNSKKLEKVLKKEFRDNFFSQDTIEIRNLGGIIDRKRYEHDVPMNNTKQIMQYVRKYFNL